jgi:hypothetical protein
MPSKKRATIACSLSSAVPSDHTLTPSSVRSAQEIATTRCRCGGMKSLPVAWRRRCETRSTTAASLTSGARSQTRRNPSTSGIVSMSNTRTGVMGYAGKTPVER